MKITFKNNKLINRIANTGLALIAVTALAGCTPAKLNVTEYMAVPTVTIEANRKQDEVIGQTKDVAFVEVISSDQVSESITDKKANLILY